MGLRGLILAFSFLGKLDGIGSRTFCSINPKREREREAKQKLHFFGNCLKSYAIVWHYIINSGEHKFMKKKLVLWSPCYICMLWGVRNNNFMLRRCLWFFFCFSTFNIRQNAKHTGCWWIIFYCWLSVKDRMRKSGKGNGFVNYILGHDFEHKYKIYKESGLKVCLLFVYIYI
jgi:hypothetical protein